MRVTQKSFILIELSLIISLVVSILVLLINPDWAQGQGLSNVAESHLALFHKNWPCDTNVDNVRALWNSFGSSKRCANKLLTKPVKSFSLALLNTTCVRRGDCAKHEILAGYSKQSLERAITNNNEALRARVIAAAKNASSYLLTHIKPQTTCYISPALEHDLSPKAFEILSSWVLPEFPSCRAINNPSGINSQKKEIPGFIYEVHGSTPRLDVECIADLDGEPVNFHGQPQSPIPGIMSDEIPRYAQKYKHCEIVSLWTCEMNGKKNCKGPSNPRDRAGFPTKEDFARIQKLVDELKAKPIEVPPWGKDDDVSLNGCTQVLEPKDGIGGFLWKQSDIHPGGVALFPSSYPQFKTVALKLNGKAFENLTFSGFGNPDSKGNRQHWRGQTPTIKLPLNIAVVAESRDERICYKLYNPKVRQD